MSAKARVAFAALLSALASTASAQQEPQPTAAPAQAAPAAAGEGMPEGTPKGPADIIGGAARARDARELEQAPARGAPQEGAAAPDPQAGSAATAESPTAADPHAAGHGQERPPQVSSERVDSALPAGTIRVQVRDAGGAPAPDAEVSLGIMQADGSRSTKEARTSAGGIATFEGLATGDRQAYRVNVPFQGARYSSNPFRLPQQGGYEVQIQRLETTRDDRMVVLYVGATSIELRDDRIHVVQQARLLNLNSKTYVFPEQGTLVELPEGFMAVQVQDSMSDQRVVEADQGVRVHGSLLPGETTLLWGFDLPRSGTDASFSIGIPWLTFAYRVIADAPEGMSLAVDGMQEPLLHQDAGRRFLITEVQRKVGDPPFQRLQITLRGIPGPGPGRFIAAALALSLIIAGVALSRRPAPVQAAEEGANFEARKQALLERARELAALREAGEIGPQYHEEQTNLIADELAALLFEQAERARHETRETRERVPEPASA